MRCVGAVPVTGSRSANAACTRSSRVVPLPAGIERLVPGQAVVGSRWIAANSSERAGAAWRWRSGLTCDLLCAGDQGGIVF